MKPAYSKFYRIHLRMGLQFISRSIALLIGGDILFRSMYWMRNNLFRYPNEIANRMVCIVAQLFILSVTTVNIFMSNLWEWHTKVQEFMVAYFIYDLIMLSSTPRGQKQILFFIHHIFSCVLLLGNLWSVKPSPVIYSNLIILLLESSSPLLNAVKIFEEYDKNAKVTRQLWHWTIFTYGISRLFLFPILMSIYLYSQYVNVFYYNVQVFMSIMIIVGSIMWFYKMVRRQ